MRKPRQIVPGASFHVIARVNRKEMIFTKSAIKDLFLNTMREAKMKYRFSISNFCIMGNHIHFIIKPCTACDISRIMQWILSVFAIRYNKRFNYTGHVWYDRFTSKVIRSFHQYLRTFLYIANNPVRAGIVKSALEYEYNGVSFLCSGNLNILERPPNQLLKTIWRLLHE